MKYNYPEEFKAKVREFTKLSGDDALERAVEEGAEPMVIRGGEYDVSGFFYEYMRDNTGYGDYAEGYVSNEDILSADTLEDLKELQRKARLNLLACDIYIECKILNDEHEKHKREQPEENSLEQ